MSLHMLNRMMSLRMLSRMIAVDDICRGAMMIQRSRNRATCRNQGKARR